MKIERKTKPPAQTVTRVADSDGENSQSDGGCSSRNAVGFVLFGGFTSVSRVGLIIMVIRSGFVSTLRLLGALLAGSDRRVRIRLRRDFPVTGSGPLGRRRAFP